MRLINGSLEVKLSTIWTDAAAEVGTVEKGRGETKKRRKKIKAGKMVGDSHETLFFPMFCGFGGVTK